MKTIWAQLLSHIMLVIFLTFSITVGTAIYLASQPKMVNLITADQEVIAHVKQYLDQNNIKYTITNSKQIEIAESIKHHTLMVLAHDNLINADYGTSYKISDETNPNNNLYELNIKRVIEGRLAKTIMDNHQFISNAVVSIDIAKFNKNSEHNTQSTASVKLVCEKTLPDETITQIQELIAKCSDYLQPEKIIVVDQNNKIISQNNEVKIEE